VLEKDLLPILVNSREDGEAFDAAVRLLVNLTVPVECLLPIGTRQQTFILDIPDSVAWIRIQNFRLMIKN
jgi:hypothetical protein